MGTPSWTDLAPDERPYHARFRPAITRDDTPGAPAAGLWLGAVPGRDLHYRPAPPVCAYFVDLDEAREWVVTAWRAVHQLEHSAITTTPTLSYTYDPADAASRDALRRWEDTVGAPLAASGVSVVTRHWVAPNPVPVPSPTSGIRPYESDEAAVIAEAADPDAGAEFLSPDAVRQQHRVQQQRLALLREQLMAQGVWTPDQNLFEQLGNLRETDYPVYQRITDELAAHDPNPYDGSRQGYLVEPDGDAPGGPPARSPWAQTWLVTPVTPACYVLWRPTPKDRPAVFFDTDNQGRPVTGRSGWFPTAAAAEAAAHERAGAEPVTVRPAERMPFFIRNAFYQRHPEALRVVDPSAPPNVSAPAIPAQS